MDGLQLDDGQDVGADLQGVAADLADHGGGGAERGQRRGRRRDDEGAGALTEAAGLVALDLHPGADPAGDAALGDRHKQAALGHVDGTYGLALMSADEPGKIVVARRGSPVLLGIGEGELFVASDASAVLSHTRSVVYLDDGDIAVLTPGDYRVIDSDAHVQLRPIDDVAWDLEAIERVEATGDRETATIHFKVKPRGNWGTGAEFYRCKATFVREADGKWRLRTFELFDPARLG